MFRVLQIMPKIEMIRNKEKKYKILKKRSLEFKTTTIIKKQVENHVRQKKIILLGSIRTTEVISLQIKNGLYLIILKLFQCFLM